MLDLNSDDDRLRSLPTARPLSGLGRLMEEATYAEVIYEGAGSGPASPTTYQQLDYAVPTTAAGELSDQGGTTALPANAVPVVQTLSTGAATLDLPKFDFNTGVASCTSCASDATSNAVAATGAKVTPLPEAPQTTNYLLWAVGLGIAFFALKGPASGAGLGCPEPAPAPAPREVLQGLPERRKKTAPSKHLASFKIS